MIVRESIVKNFNKNCVFCAIIIFSIQKSCQGIDAAGVKMAQELNKGLEKTANSLKADMPNVGANAAKTISKSVDRAVTAGVGIAIGAGIYVVYKEFKKGYLYFFPDKEKQLREEEASRKLNILKAEKELYKSLVAHAREGKNYRGIPDACEEAANKYAAVAGFDSLGKMIEEFKRATEGESLAHCTSAA